MVEIRLARPEEYAEVGEVTLTAYAEFVDADTDDYAHRLRDAASRAADAELWVAVEAGEVVGTVTTCPPGSPWREIAEVGEGEFRMLAVPPAARGRGVGEALVAHVVALSRAQGDRAVVLSSLREMTAAHRVYVRAGFARVPERDWSPVAGVDLVAYRCEWGAVS